MNSVITIAVVAVGIVAALFVARPYYEGLVPDLIPEVTTTEIINEHATLSSGRAKSYQVLTGDAESMRLTVYPHNEEAKLAINVYYSDGQNKTFAGKKQLSYVIDFDTPLSEEITLEPHSTVIVDLNPLSQSNVNVKLSLKYVS